MSENKYRPGTAAVLSFVFSGWGQLYNGQIVKGLIIIFLTVLSLLFVMSGAVLVYVWLMRQALSQLLWTGIALFTIGLVLICILGIYSIVDAYKKAKML
jgi:TM2 domain-containing membrane protein YozV